MKYIKFALVAALVVQMLCLVGLVEAASVQFQVDVAGQQFDAVKIYQANLPRDFAFTDPPAYSGTSLTPVISGLTPGQTYKFIAVITRGSKQSPGSNVVQQQIPVVVVLTAPTLTIKAITGE